METPKTKSAAKIVTPLGAELRKKILATSRLVADIVGGTLGPGGHPVLIERSEAGLPPIVTKDGVTVFRSLALQDPTMHCIVESMRDASVRTATEAGDGTTTATVLADALLQGTLRFCEENPGVSPQRLTQDIKDLHAKVLTPVLASLKLRGDLSSPDGRRRLRGVAAVSTNGDMELADAVVDCFDICGDDGNVTLAEASGPPGVRKDRIEGFPIGIGYEQCCQRYYPSFINRADLQQVHIESPVFLLNFGRVNDIQVLRPILEKLQEAYQGEYLKTPNVVVVATGFSESVLAALAHNWAAVDSLNIYPLVVPMDSPIANAARNFMDDLAAVTGATVRDPETANVVDATFADLGNITLNDQGVWVPLGVKRFEASRYRSTIVGFCDEAKLLARHSVVLTQAKQAESELEATMLRERLAKLVGGIARLTITGSSNGELKERRDRAEDAICAVRGAIKDGCLPAGGWALMRLHSVLRDMDTPAAELLCDALCAPLERLLSNAGLTDDEIDVVYHDLLNGTEKPADAQIFDAANKTMVCADEVGLLDSYSAVAEALKNSVSIASLLGTLGGCVVFPRNSELEFAEARSAAEFDRMSKFNPADERP